MALYCWPGERHEGPVDCYVCERPSQPVRFFKRSSHGEVYLCTVCSDAYRPGRDLAEFFLQLEEGEAKRRIADGAVPGKVLLDADCWRRARELCASDNF